MNDAFVKALRENLVLKGCCFRKENSFTQDVLHMF
jgi:hypothetical protein